MLCVLLEEQCFASLSTYLKLLSRTAASSFAYDCPIDIVWSHHPTLALSSIAYHLQYSSGVDEG